jgi:sec-independent protein translocase protein TatA
MIHPLANLFGAEWNWIIIVLAALLLFGKRLPEVGRSLGKGIVEFKKGLAGIEDELNQSTNRPSGATVSRLPGDTTAKSAIEAGYKFDPYTGKPLVVESAAPPMRFDPYTGKPISQEAATAAQGNSNIGA